MNFHGNTDRPKSRITATESNSSGRTWDFVAGPGGRSGPGIEKGPTGAGNSSLKRPFEKADSDDQAQKKPLEEGTEERPAKRVKLQTSSKDTSNPPQDKTSQISDSHTMAKTRDEAGLSQSQETGNKSSLQSLANVALKWIEGFKESIPNPTSKQIDMYNYATSMYNFTLKKLGNYTDLSPMMPVRLALDGGSEASFTEGIPHTPRSEGIDYRTAINNLERYHPADAENNAALRLRNDLRRRNSTSRVTGLADRLVNHLTDLVGQESGEWEYVNLRTEIIEDIRDITNTAALTSVPLDDRRSVMQFLHRIGIVDAQSLAIYQAQTSS